MSASHPAYHSRRGDGDAPAALVPASRPRLPTESYPGSIRTVAFGNSGHYVCSLSAYAAIPQMPPEEYPLVRTDYRLGPHEPMLYPQMWSPTAPHMAWIEKHELHRELHQRDIVAYVFQYHDWNPCASMSEYGRISGDLLCRLDLAFHEIYVKALPFLKTARTRLLVPSTTITECTRLLSDLKVLTSTFKDSATMVTRVQRGIAELRAFRLFRLDVQHHVGDEFFVSDAVYNYIGVFTSDRAMVDLLHRLGVPAWLVVSGLPRGSHPQPPVPFSKFLETKPLNQLDEYHTDWAGRRHRNRETSPPSYSAPSETDPHAVPQARTSRRRSRSPPRVRLAPPHDVGRPSTSASRRSRSPSTSGVRQASVSVVPRYVLHEQSRLKDSKTRRHPDAPETWRPRDWATDPGNQAAQHVELPTWVPELPTWLRNVASSVDRSVTREWRLCANDCIHPVPQEIFDRPLEYAMPPLHLLLKHEKRFKYVFSAWAALRDFWLHRQAEEGYCALSATTWRKVLDDKYNISKDLAAWIDSNRPGRVSPSEIVSPAVEPAPASRTAHETHLATLRSEIRDARLEEVPAAGEPGPLPYTRLGQPGEDLIVATSRVSAAPENWATLFRQLEVYCETSPRRMHCVDERCLEELRAGDARWDEYWDYDYKRIVLFNRSSRVPDECPTNDDCELLLNEGALTWHLSLSDEKGLGRASRAVWRAANALVVDSTGALLTLPAASSTAQSTSSGGSINAPSASRTISDAAGDPRESPSMKSQGTAPPPDPVYAYHAQLPNGQHSDKFLIRQHRISKDDLVRNDIRAFLIWEIAEAEFRFQLRRTDTYVLKSIGLWNADVEKERQALLMKVWGGEDGYVPSGMATPAQTDAEPRRRFASIYNFWNLIRSWPRCREIPNLAHYVAREGLSQEQLLRIEHDVWKFYAQTYLDYFGILPALPRCMPDNPFLLI